MTMTMTADKPLDDDLKIGLRVLASFTEPVSVVRLPLDIVDQLIVAELAELVPGGALTLTESGQAAAHAMTPKAKQMRLAVAFGRPISEAAKRALLAVARDADDADVIALAAEIHALSVAAAPLTPAQAHLEEWIT